MVESDTSLASGGFAKNERDNVDDNELTTLREIAKVWFAADARGLARAIAEGLIQEVTYDEEEKA